MAKCRSKNIMPKILAVNLSKLKIALMNLTNRQTYAVIKMLTIKAAVSVNAVK